MKGNLKGAMQAKKISSAAMAALLGVTEKTVNNKLNGESEFLLSEAMKIKENLFPEYDLGYLFATTADVA